MSSILQKKMCVIVLLLAINIIIQAQAPEATVVANPPETESAAVTPAQHSILVQQLQSLLTPSPIALEEKQKRNPAKPYYRIIPGLDGYSTLVYRFRYVEATKEMVNSVESAISSQGIVERSPEQNVIVVHDRTDKMEELANLMMALDIEAPQILVEAKVVEVNIGDGMQRNLNFQMNRHDTTQGNLGTTKDLDSSAGIDTSIQGQSKTDGGLALDWFPYVGDNKNFQVTLQWLMHGQRAKILSAPNVVVSRNAVATITTGQEVPIQESLSNTGGVSSTTKYKQVGVILEINPKFINQDAVTLTVSPQVSNITSYTRIQTGTTTYEVPSMSIRKIDTTLNMTDGQVIMMGGLYSDKETLNEERVPFLSDLPYLGDLFTSKNRSRELVQLIFFLRINILTAAADSPVVLYDVGKQAQEIRDLGQSVMDSKELFPADLDVNKSTLEQVKEEFLEKKNSLR